MKKILITGATGFLGSRLVEKMSTINGLEILATGRTLKTQNISNKSNLEFVLGNLEDTKFIDSLTSGIDTIIHTAALSSQMGNPKDFHRTNIEVTKNLLKAAKAKRVKKFIFISSPSVYFRFKHQLDLKESDPKSIFGSSDDFKLKSCMTLFLKVDPHPQSIFQKILDKFYYGRNSRKTIKIINRDWNSN